MIIYLLHTVYMFLSIEENIKGSPGGVGVGVDVSWRAS